MKLVGQVHWIGGYSKKLEKQLDYGYIKLGDESESVKFNISDIKVLDSIKADDYVLVDVNNYKKNNRLYGINIEIYDEVKYIEYLTGLRRIKLENALENVLELFSKSFRMHNNKTNYIKFLSVENLRNLKIHNYLNVYEKATIYSEGFNKGEFVVEEYLNFLEENKHKISSFKDTVPLDILINNRDLFYKLNEEDIAQFIAQFINSNIYEEFTREAICKMNYEVIHILLDKLNYGDHDVFNKIKSLGIWEKISLNKKIQILLNKDLIINQEDELILLSTYLIEKVNYHEHLEILKKYGVKYIKENSLLKNLHIQIKDELFEKGELEWEDLCHYSKTLSVIRLSSENIDFNFLREYKDLISEDKLLHGLVKILFLKNVKNPKLKYLEFKAAHNLIQEFVIDKAWDLDENIDLSLVLPYCAKYNRYCDSREWRRYDNDTKTYELTYYCKRRSWNDKCYAYKADLDKPWFEWSLKELIENSSISPYGIDGLTKPNEYTHKLAGWLNRLNEIRSRLRCSKCQTPFKPNLKYAKHLAKFTTTVLSCVHEGVGHDKNIYFNQCWHCKEVIDSRESRIYKDDMYLCIHCGAGPTNTNYIIGSICPKCGGENMEINKSNKNIASCLDCNHIINISR